METNYPNLRTVLDPAYAEMTDGELEFLFESALGEGVTPAEYEEFFGSLAKSFGSFANDAGRAIAKAGPGLSQIGAGALQGAAAGSALGPWGALGGALVGGTGAGLKAYGSGTTRDVGSAIGSVVGVAGQLSGRGAAGGAASSLIGAGQQALGGQRPSTGSLVGAGIQALGSRSPAAGQLASLLSRPEILAALGALASGRNPGIPIGQSGNVVPAHALAGLLGALGREAEQESLSQESDESVPAYLVDRQGNLVVDPREPDLRAARVLQIIHEADEAEGWHGDESDEGDEADEADEAFDDALDEGFDDAIDEFVDSIDWWAA